MSHRVNGRGISSNDSMTRRFNGSICSNHRSSLLKNRIVGRRSAPRRGPSRLTVPFGGRRAGTPVTQGTRRHNPARLATQRQPVLASSAKPSHPCDAKTLAPRGRATSLSSARLGRSGARGPSVLPLLHLFPARGETSIQLCTAETSSPSLDVCLVPSLPRPGRFRSFPHDLLAIRSRA